MNIKQNTLAALLVLGIGMSGCNNSDNNPASQIEDKKADKNKTIPTPPVENNDTDEENRPNPPVENNDTDEENRPNPPVENNDTDEENRPNPPVENNDTDEENRPNPPVENNDTDEENRPNPPVENNDTDEENRPNPPVENNDTDEENRPNPPVENNNTDENRTATILGNIGSQHSNHNSTITVAQLREVTPALSNIIASNLNSYRSYIEDPSTNFSTLATIAQVQIMLDTVNTSESVLGSIGNQHSNGSSDITIAQLQEITPALSNIDDRYLNIYQRYIASADTNISSPATVDEVQSMIDEVNDLNLPTNAILDRSFFKKTNGAFEHRFVYLPVENTTTGRTWLNNNLGADYANVDSSNYNALQQATARNDYKAYGSLFQWGRKADGHELFDWTGATAGTAKHGKTSTKVDEPSDSLFITSNGNYSDWRATQDDTLWANESSANSVCPVGYRLPLDPNGADDGENELAVEINSWSSKDINGSMSSDLKLPSAGFRWINSNRDYTANEGIYWSGSVVPSDGNNSTVSNARNVYFGNPGDVNLHDTTHRGAGSSVRCIKDQTPAERSVSILKVIGNEHGNHKSTVTVAQLKAITPALENINDDYQDSYRSYIASADTSFSSPATIGEVQSMIDAMNNLNLPEHAILDRSFFEKTNGIFEHRFVYLPVTNSTTGRTWLNNNLGADYANVDSSDYNPSQQATARNDYKAYGSFFQWGRKADGHELMNWVTDHNGTTKYGETNTTNDNPSDSLFITKYSDWRATPDDTLWASESSANNVCPVGYRLPLNPNGAVDANHELAVELNSWSSKDAEGSMSSVLKLPTAGGLTSSGVITWWTPGYGDYWTGSVVPSDGNNSTVSNARDVYFGNALGLLDTSGRGIGFSVRCIKD